jgi:hypothetical protein
MYHALFRRSGVRAARRSRFSTARDTRSTRTCARIAEIDSSTRNRRTSCPHPSLVAGCVKHKMNCAQEFACAYRPVPGQFAIDARHETRRLDARVDAGAARTARAGACAREPRALGPVRANRTRQCPVRRVPLAPGCRRSGALDRRARRAGDVTRATGMCLRPCARPGARHDACASRAQVEPPTEARAAPAIASSDHGPSCPRDRERNRGPRCRRESPHRALARPGCLARRDAACAPQ